MHRCSMWIVYQSVIPLELLYANRHLAVTGVQVNVSIKHLLQGV